MALTVQLREVIPQHMLEAHHEHIQDFLLQEGIRPNETDLGATLMSERQVKELLEELASNIED
jgi:hypothetical protein